MCRTHLEADGQLPQHGVHRRVVGEAENAAQRQHSQAAETAQRPQPLPGRHTLRQVDIAQLLEGRFRSRQWNAQLL